MSTGTGPGGGTDNGPSVFGKRDALRVASATREVERKVKGGTGGARALGAVGFVPQGGNAKTGGSGIPAMTGDTPGKATIRLWKYDASDTLVDSGIDVDGYNTVPTAVAANTKVTWLWVEGRRQVIVEPCPP